MNETVEIRRRPRAGRFHGTSLHPVLQRIYDARQIEHHRQLERELDRLIPFTELMNIDAAAQHLYQALQRQQKILVVGDFDADGATSSALALRALRAFGCRQVDFLVPNRFEFGYGLTPEIVDVALKRRPDLIITVDNGISSIDGVASARAAGIDVLVTDHHLPAECLPDANVIVNPNQRGDRFPSKHLAGVGVIFYVMLALRSLLRRQGWFAAQRIAEPNMGRFLDLVALGTVADLVPLDENNRVLVYQGIQRIRAGRACAGIKALLRVSRREPQRLVASDLGFAVGPRLNAAGRLQDMALGISCLLTDDFNEALAMAEELDTLNQERRRIETEMKAEADAGLEAIQLGRAGEMPPGLCLFDRGWHQGVIGILASRLKEKYHRPVIVFAEGEQGRLKGSARSVPGLHMRDLLDSIAAAHQGLIKKFGGHAMAAGLSLAAEDFSRFRQAYYQALQGRLTEEMLQQVILTDGELAADELTLELAQLLRDAGPWGQGFPEPVFEGRFVLHTQRVVGEKHLKLLLQPCSGEQLIDAIAFNQAALQAAAGSELYLVYRLDVNEFNGRRSAQLIVEHLRVDNVVGVAEPG